jgi:hypothetical protein
MISIEIQIYLGGAGVGLVGFQTFANLLDELGVLREAGEAPVHLVDRRTVPERVRRGDQNDHVTKYNHESERDDQRRDADGSWARSVAGDDAEPLTRRRRTGKHLEKKK